ncbi:molecular chaperone [Pseudomonas abieticivorans]|uniref:molecular chaperone n=1 Tax=Pseudomonas abieticivorans TaxID=2931382 RepID=UPI0020BDDC68|nr:molecular chaperone [Pseudomonas sp. PIA16]
MSSSSPHLLLRAPTPSQLSLTFCEATPRDMKRWIATLPKANLGETARQLYQGLLELNQLVTRSENRLQLLELLRPEVYYVCKHLERHFLNQSIVLDERARKVANLCQALQNHLAVGYKQIICRLSPKFSKDRAALLSMAIQRALHCLNGPLIRASLLYCPVPDGLWRELHQLYQVALHHQLQQQVVPDELASHARTLSIEQTYAAALLMGSSRCNQMRQGSIARLADVLESWGALVRVQAACDDNSLFAVAPAIDGPPRYKSLFVEAQATSLLGLDPSKLVQAIDSYLQLPAEQRSGSPLLVPQGFTIDLLQHLNAAWGDVAERTFHRAPGQGNLSVCIGMSALHYYLSGERSFSEVLRRPEVGSANFASPQARKDDSSTWALAFDAPQNSTQAHMLPYEEIQYHNEQGDGASSASNAQQDFPIHALNIINHSPGGYCLAWPKEVPAQLQAGEMLGIQDSPAQGWSIAVVRWIRQVRSGGTQMGIELVAPYAQPCGLQLLRNAQESSQYLRGLLLPEIRAIDIPASMIAPRLPFQEGNKVMINTKGEEKRASLGKRVSGTGSFNQFEYKTQEPLASKAVASGEQVAGENFDSLWGDL